jgi:hypothetical protein
MSNLKNIRKTETAVRSSMPYAQWVVRNKGVACFHCDSSEDLELHHIVELRHILLGLWKLYGDFDSVLQHCLAMHDDDRCECVTLCEGCHSSTHPSRIPLPKNENPDRIAMWCAVPRNLGYEFSLGTKGRTSDRLSLIQFQTMLGIGWHIINGQFEYRIVEFNRRRFAELIGKCPGTSFNASLVRALNELQDKGIVLGYLFDGNDAEVHLSRTYLVSIRDNPWFMGLNDIQTSSMAVLAVRWFLGLQSNRKSYRISLGKLARHLGISSTSSPASVRRLVVASIDDIPWARVSINGDIFEFKLSRRGAVPIHSLRHILRDNLHLPS